MLYVTLEAVRIAAVLVQPVMPESAVALFDLLGQAADALGLRAALATPCARHLRPPHRGVSATNPRS